MPYITDQVPRRPQNIGDKIEFWLVTIPVVVATGLLIIVSTAILTIWITLRRN